MAFRRGGGGRKRDANEPDIRKALAACGRKTFQISGTGLPDLLIWSPAPFVAVHGFWLPAEVKVEGGDFTEHQDDARFPVLRSIEDALAIIGVTR